MWKYLNKDCNCNTTPTNPGVVCNHDGLKANELIYRGLDVACSGIYNGMTVAEVLQQIDYYLCSLEFTQQVLDIIQDNPQEFNDFITLVNGAINCETITSCGNPPSTTTTTSTSSTTSTTTSTTTLFPPECIEVKINFGTNCPGQSYAILGYTDCNGVEQEVEVGAGDLPRFCVLNNPYPSFVCGDGTIDIIGNCDPITTTTTSTIVPITTTTTTTEAPVFCEGNLAANPTFDTNLSGWVNETGEWAWVPTWGGSACYRGLDSLGRLSQDILTPGESYNLSFTMHNNTTCTENGYIMVEAGTNSYGPFTTSGTSVVSIVVTAAVNGKLTFIGDDSCLAEEIFDRLWIDNVCVTLIPTTTTTSTTILTTTTTTTLEPTTTTTTTDIPTTTTTSTTEFAGMLHLSLISASSNPTDACPLPLVDTVYIWKNDPGDVPTQGDRIYLDALMTTPFIGDNNYWHITIQSSTFTVSAEVDSLGFISSSFISLCV